MGGIVLLGCEESKRTSYFLAAALELSVNIEFLDIRNFDKKSLENKLVKIDPVTYDSSQIDDLDFHVNNYMKLLEELKYIDGIRFLNTPDAIINVLSKENCKRVLMENSIPTTKMLGFNFSSYEELRDIMHEKRMYNVFIKPSYGSGAVGVVAYRFNPKLNTEAMYTSAVIKENKLINTKRINKYEDKSAIKAIINKLLKGTSIVESWTPKAKHGNFSYDLRVVVQFGKVDFIVGRLSKKPITNLHLNNNAVDVNELSISEDKLAEIKELCINATKPFNGLNVAGIDLLLTRDSLKPMIIEINAQGDQVYRDMYNENLIYKNQALEMRRLSG